MNYHQILFFLFRWLACKLESWMYDTSEVVLYVFTDTMPRIVTGI